MSRFTLAVALSVLAASCGGSTQPAEGPGMEHGALPPGPVVPNAQAKVGDKTKCPVSGETFVVKADSPKVEHQGKSYWLCCAHCKGQFEANPEKFLGT